jgi:hypothetical protein
MEPEAFDMALRAMYRRRPFRSFTVELVTGENIVVDHPESMVMRHGVAVFLDKTGTPNYFDHLSVNRFVDSAGPSTVAGATG